MLSTAVNELVIPAHNFIAGSPNVIKNALPHAADAISTRGPGGAFVEYEVAVPTACTANVFIEYALDTGPRAVVVSRRIVQKNKPIPDPKWERWEPIGRIGEVPTKGWADFVEFAVGTVGLLGEYINRIKLENDVYRAEGTFPHIRKIIFRIL